MRISNLESGQRFKVRGHRPREGGGQTAGRYGLYRRTRGKVIRRGLMGGPMEVRILGYEVIIRRVEAAGIEVESLSAREESGSTAVAPGGGGAPRAARGGAPRHALPSRWRWRGTRTRARRPCSTPSRAPTTRSGTTRA